MALGSKPPPTDVQSVLVRTKRSSAPSPKCISRDLFLVPLWLLYYGTYCSEAGLAYILCHKSRQYHTRHPPSSSPPSPPSRNKREDIFGHQNQDPPRSNSSSQKRTSKHPLPQSSGAEATDRNHLPQVDTLRRSPAYKPGLFLGRQLPLCLSHICGPHLIRLCLFYFCHPAYLLPPTISPSLPISVNRTFIRRGPDTQTGAMRCRRRSGNVVNDEVYVKELTTTLEKIRIASVRAE